MERKSERRSGQRPALVLKTTENAILMKSTQELTIEEAHEEARKENATRNLSALESDIQDITGPYYALFAAEIPTHKEEKQGKKVGILPFLGKIGTKTQTFHHDHNTGTSYSYEITYRRDEQENKIQTAKLFIDNGSTLKDPALSLSFHEQTMTELHLNWDASSIQKETIKKFEPILTFERKTFPLRYIDAVFPEDFKIKSMPFLRSMGTIGKSSFVGASFKYDAEKDLFTSDSHNISLPKEEYLGLIQDALSIIPTLDLNEKK